MRRHSGGVGAGALAAILLGATGCAMAVIPVRSDGGSAGDGGDAGDAVGAPTRRGVVSLTLDTSTSPQTVAYFAEFWAAPAALPAGCTQSNEGACVVRVCAGAPDVAASLYDPYGGSVASSAGSISLFEISGSYEALDPNAAHVYRAFSVRDPTAAMGSTFRLMASGADVPSFMGTVQLPPALQGLDPAVGTALTVDGTTPVTMRWQPFAGDEVTVAFADTVVTSGGASGVAVYCTYRSDAGVATVPAAAFASLPSGASAPFNVLTASRTELVAGDYAVTLLGLNQRSPYRITRR